MKLLPLLPIILISISSCKKLSKVDEPHYIYDTTVSTLYVHDTVYKTATLLDTVVRYNTNPAQPDTIIINKTRVDTVFYTKIDTVYLTFGVHDTVNRFVTVTVHDTLIQNVKSTVHDTSYITKVIQVHDTVTRTQYLHDTVNNYVKIFLHDTLIRTNTVTIHDTLWGMYAPPVSDGRVNHVRELQYNTPDSGSYIISIDLSFNNDIHSYYKNDTGQWKGYVDLPVNFVGGLAVNMMRRWIGGTYCTVALTNYFDPLVTYQVAWFKGGPGTLDDKGRGGYWMYFPYVDVNSLAGITLKDHTNGDASLFDDDYPGAGQGTDGIHYKEIKSEKSHNN